MRTGSFGLCSLSSEIILYFLGENRGFSLHFLNLLTQRNLASPSACSVQLCCHGAGGSSLLQRQFLFLLGCLFFCFFLSPWTSQEGVDCRSSVEMANLMVSKTSKHLISSHPTLCGGFLLVLLMTFIAVANRERAKEKKKKETCYFCCHRCTQDISFRKLELEKSLISYYSSCPSHACSSKILCSILQHEALKKLIIHFNHSNWFTCTFLHRN